MNETAQTAYTREESAYLTKRFEQHGVQQYNPFNLRETDECYQILIDCNYTTAPDSATPNEKRDWFGIVAVPSTDSEGNERHLEDVATIAFRLAQEYGLKSRLMSLCSFFYLAHDGETDGWVQFL